MLQVTKIVLDGLKTVLIKRKLNTVIFTAQEIKIIRGYDVPQ